MGIFEAHFHDSEIKPSIHIGPKGFGATEDDDETDWSEEFDVDEESEGGPSVLGLVVLSIVFAVVATVVAKKLAGGDGDEE